MDAGTLEECTIELVRGLKNRRKKLTPSINPWLRGSRTALQERIHELMESLHAVAQLTRQKRHTSIIC
jgi:hypothetical protein